MTHFVELDDSPMFQKRICSLEQSADQLKERCQNLYKGCKKFMEALGEAYMGDIAFADSLQAFGGGPDDPVSFSIGGPIISRFINAFHELAGHKELLRSQVEHVLVDRLMHFMTVDLQDVKESRRLYDKAVTSYDQAREKFVSLKKNTRGEIVADLEENLQNSKSVFEKSRFNLVNGLMNIEAKKKYEFLESISAIMDAHLRYFKLGHDLFSQLEPYIHQILTYAQQSKEMANVEKDKLAKRIQEFTMQAEMESLKGSGKTDSPKSAGRPVIGLSSCKINGATVLSKTNGEVQTIKKGYLLKRPSKLRGDWKRRFFVLDSPGTLYYYTNKVPKTKGSHHRHRSVSVEQNTSMFARLRSRYSNSPSLNDDILSCRTVDLQISMIKMDAEDTDLRLCFRIISPSKTYTLQAENEIDRKDWVDKINGAIASLLSSNLMHQPLPIRSRLKDTSSGQADASDIRPPHKLDSSEAGVLAILREIPGNDICAECSAPDPDWASVNLGVLLCIQCSGVHRNLGVHISKVRSLTLDVKVWEHTILELFRALGNTYCNSIWEGRLLIENDRVDDKMPFESLLMKPCRSDTFYHKEKYIYSKYVEKLLLVQDDNVSGSSHMAKSIWEAVKTRNLREVYHLIAASDARIVNTTFDDASNLDSYHSVSDIQDPMPDRDQKETKHNDPADCKKINDTNDPGSCLQGCSLLHLACHLADAVMLELLLQFGADINKCDFHGRTPLQLCIAVGNNQLAKFLLRRGAHASIKDGGGLNALERAMEKGVIADEQLFILLSES